MSTPNPTHIIADSIRGEIINADAIAAHVVSKLTDAGYSIVPNEQFDAACDVLGLITDTWRGLVMDTPTDQALHARVVENADTHIAKLRKFLPAAAEGEKP